MDSQETRQYENDERFRSSLHRYTRKRKVITWRLVRALLREVLQLDKELLSEEGGRLARAISLCRET